MGIPEIQPCRLLFPQATREDASVVSGSSISFTSGHVTWIRELDKGFSRC